MFDPLVKIYESKVMVNPLFQEIYNRIKIVNGRKEIAGDVDLRHKNLQTLPDLSDVRVLGYFDCSTNKLTSLKGAPVSVGGGFYCDDNELTTLQGVPTSIGSDFYCYDNMLTTLQGAPMSVGGSFSCINNKLTSLQYAPASVGGGFYCDNNKLPKDVPEKMTSEEYAKYQEKLRLQARYGDEIGGIVNDL